MNPAVHAYKTGWRRALIETRISLTTPSDVMGYLLPVGVSVTVLLFMRGVDIEGSPISLGTMNMPSLIGMMVVWGGVMGVLAVLVMDRTNGTLLRAKSMPGGMTGYLIGHLGSIALFSTFGAAVMLAVGLAFFDDLEFATPDRWLMFAASLILGMAATLPVGAVLGALIDNPRNLGLVMLPFMALMAVSGIFYPLGAMPGWAQAVGQVFPTYWAGLGMRHALLPDAAASIEIGGSWRTLTMLAVLTAWAVAAIAAAPKLLGRMARRESGSTMAARRQKMYEQWG